MIFIFVLSVCFSFCLKLHSRTEKARQAQGKQHPQRFKSTSRIHAQKTGNSLSKRPLPVSCYFSTLNFIRSPQCGQMINVCFSLSSETFSLSINSVIEHPIASAIFASVESLKSFFSLNKRDIETRLISRRFANSIWLTPYFSKMLLNFIVLPLYVNFLFAHKYTIISL